MALQDILTPFRQANAYWFVSRAFWAYPDQMTGMPGFHRFLQRLIEYQESETIWNWDREMEVLIMLEDEGILRPWENQDDWHANFRIRIAFAKHMGLAIAGVERPLALTAVGAHFLKSQPEEWPLIFEHQLIRWQLTNPRMTQRYQSFRLFPYAFTLATLLDVEGHFLTLEEFALRVFLCRQYEEREHVLRWVEAFRGLSESEREIARAEIDLNHSYAARMLMLLFAYTPSIGFEQNMLLINDEERARYLLAKCWPYLNYADYASEDEWAARFGSFESAFWPLLSETTERRRYRYSEYVKREESDVHKAIKRYLVESAELLFGGGTRLFEEEYTFSSNDRANLVFSLPQRRYLAVEVEADVGQDDITGLLQAVKYKYMFAVQESLSYEQVDGLLAARSIHHSIRDACERYGIAWREINPTKGEG